MTLTAERIDDLLRRPPSEVLPALREAGLLPERPTTRVWGPDPDQAVPVVAPFAVVDPRKPYVADRASLYTYRPQWYASSGTAPAVSIHATPGQFDGTLYVMLTGLGAGRPGLVVVDLLVYGPAGTSLSISATGNPVITAVSREATGGQRVQVPVGFASNSAGTALVYLAPTQVGHGGEWYGTTVYGL
ncbi:MAG TPA: hypothetical protein VH479_01460 [Acidimicrobiales bacterium]|jgi:hypothetical protein